jgi:hypothetical protein
VWSCPLTGWHVPKGGSGMTDQPTTGQKRPARLSEDLIEKLADAEHASWARWMDYLFGRCYPEIDGSLMIPADLVARWQRQVATPYADLGESEKQSDRNEVAHIVPFIAAELDATRAERDAWKARAERLGKALEPVLSEAWRATNNFIIARQALAEPQPTLFRSRSEEHTADHPWFAWLPPTVSTHRNCCDRPQSEHPEEEIVLRRARGLDGERE